MTSLPRLIALLASAPGPVLTVYSAERVEFNGPVLARWFAKISNLLDLDLGADLFGTGSGGAGGFVLRHGLWQEIVWTLPLLAMGWSPLASSEDAGPGDLLLVDAIDEDAAAALEAGATVLAQPREHLSFSWRGAPLPAGALDALAEVMAHSDALEVEPPATAPSIEEIVAALEAGSGDAAEGPSSPVVAASRICAREGPESLPLLLRAWLAGGSVVLVDPERYSAEEAGRIATSEGAGPV